MPPKPKILRLSEQVYRRMLKVYPEAHRREYGELMTQLFRDQSKEAWQKEGTAGLIRHWLRSLVDLGRSSVKEQIGDWERNTIMKFFRAENSPTRLLLAGLVLGLLSFAPFILQSAGLFQAILISSSLAILAKAIVEMFRPGREWLKMGLRTLVLMFAFALFMPAWAKLKLTASLSPDAHDFFGFFLMACLFSNPLVTLVKLLQHMSARINSKAS